MATFGAGTFGSGTFGGLAYGVTILDIVDTDLTTVLWAFDDAAGILNPGGIRTRLSATFDAGTAQPEFAIGAGRDAHVAARDYAPVEFAVPFMASADTGADLREGIEELVELLDRGASILRWTEGGLTRYIDVLEVLNLPTLVRGQAEGGLISPRATSLGPIPLQMLRRPSLFTDLVTETPAVVKNDPASGTNPKWASLTVDGNMPTTAIVKIAPEAGASLVQARVARRSDGDTTFRTRWYQEAENGTLTNSASVADAAATGSDALDLFTASETNFGERARWAFSGVEGTFRIFARVKVPASNTVRLQARYAPGSTTSLIPLEVVTLTMPAGVSSQYAMVDMGVAATPQGQGTPYGLSVALWAAQDDGSDVVAVDTIQLWPIGAAPAGRGAQSLLVSTPGWRDQSGRSVTTYSGDRLLNGGSFSWGSFTGGTATGGIMKLNDVDDTDAAGIPPAAGVVYPAGTVRVKARCRLIATVQDQTLGVLGVRNITGSSTLTQETALGAHNRDATKTFEVSFTANGTSAYQPFVHADNLGTEAAEIRVQWMSVEVIPTVGTGNEMNTSGEYGHVRGLPAAYLTASGTHAGALSQEGAFIDLYPGVNDLYYDWGEMPSAGMEQADPRGPLALSTLDRNCTVTVSYYPRWSA